LNYCVEENKNMDMCNYITFTFNLNKYKVHVSNIFDVYSVKFKRLIENNKQIEQL